MKTRPDPKKNRTGFTPSAPEARSVFLPGDFNRWDASSGSIASGIEVTVRFPVELQNAVDIDDRVMRELHSAIEQEPKLKLVGSGMPTLRTDISTPTHA